MVHDIHCTSSTLFLFTLHSNSLEEYVRSRGRCRRKVVPEQSRMFANSYMPASALLP